MLSCTTSVSDNVILLHIGMCLSVMFVQLAGNGTRN